MGNNIPSTPNVITNHKMDDLKQQLKADNLQPNERMTSPS